MSNIKGLIVFVLCVVLASCSIFADKEKDEAKISLPGISIETKGDDANIKMPGLKIQTKDGKAQIDIPGLKVISAKQINVVDGKVVTTDDANNKEVKVVTKKDADQNTESVQINANGKTIEVKVNEKDGVVEIPGLNLKINKDGSQVNTTDVEITTEQTKK